MDPCDVEDWADQDLLTKDEARDRLGVAIIRAQNRLAALKYPDDEAEILSVTQPRPPWRRSAVSTTLSYTTSTDSQ